MFLCPWENPSYRLSEPTQFRPYGGWHLHGLELGILGTQGMICGHCRRCQTCGATIKPEPQPSTNCEACWHLWNVHGPSGCHALAGGLRCPCEHAPPEPEPQVELRLGGRKPGLYVDGKRLP